MAGRQAAMSSRADVRPREGSYGRRADGSGPVVDDEDGAPAPAAGVRRRSRRLDLVEADSAGDATVH